MLDTTRYRGILTVTVALVAAAVAVHFVLGGVFGPRPDFLLGEQSVVARKYIDQSDRRVSGVAAAYRRGQLDEDDPVCFFIGLSTAQEGLDGDVLAEHDGMNGRYVGLCGGGGCMEHVREVARPLLRSKLQPALVLLGVHPSWLVGRPLSGAKRIQLSPRMAYRARGLDGVVQNFTDWYWLTVNRKYVSYQVRAGLYNLRSAMFERLDLPADAFRTPDAAAWRPLENVFPDTVSAEEKQLQIAKFAKYGQFDPRAYEHYQSRQAAVLVDMITACRRSGAEVAVVLMPETSAFHRRIPPEARQYLDAALVEAFGEDPPVVWDFQTAIPDDMFADYVHLTEAGQRKLSLLVAEEIRRRTSSLD